MILALLFALALPTDTLLVDLQLSGSPEHRVVEVILTRDSLLLLPAREVNEFLGLPQPTATWTTPAELRSRWPAISVTVLLRELRLVIDDPLAVLPISRQLRDQRERQGRGAAPLTVTRSGPFLALAADDNGRSLVDLGYSWRGRVAVTGRQSSTFGSSWGVSLAPSPKAFISYAGGQRQTPSASARVAAGPVWAFASWTPDHWSADGLVTWGRVSLFASSREAFALTINAVPVGAQIGWSGGRTTARNTYGPVMPSPFTVPVVP